MITQTGVEVIGPEQALLLLESADPTRKTDLKEVGELAADMMAGNWKQNGESILIDKNGRLVSGSQRMQAVIAANMLVPMTVTRQLKQEEMMADRKGPPTGKQLERIDQLLDHPAMDGYIDSLAGKWDQLIATMGGAGVLIGWMKGIIAKEEAREAALIALRAALGNSSAISPESTVTFMVTSAASSKSTFSPFPRNGS
jgi:hypothetical protein